jgi:hypothetical protein
MYGDTSVMRRRAEQLREQGVDIAVKADDLVAQADGIDWTGRAAQAMRARIRDRAAHLREAAAAHETAADSLQRHLAEVDRLKDAIAGIEQRASSLVADARTRVARLDSAADPDGVRVEPTEADRTLVSFVPPQPGHKDWLTVTLPGL